MTREEWNTVKTGDVLRIPRKGGTHYLRTVLSHGGYRNTLFVVLPIMRRSWTGRVTTTHDYNSLGFRVEIHQRGSDMAMTGNELLRLCECRFDIPAELKREAENPNGSLRGADDTMRAKLAGASTLARHYCPAS